MSDYLDEEEQLARLKGWWDENANTVIFSVIAVVVGIVGWNWFGDHSESQKHEATRAYEAYETAGDDKTAELDELESEFGGSAVHLFALFDQARLAVSEGDPEKARGILEKAIEVGDDAIVVDLARIRLARLQRELDLADEALATLDKVRDEGYRALVLEVKGDIHASRGEIELAHQSYQAAVDSLREGETRPFLSMKLENTAPFDGEYVAMTDTLTEALREAEKTLQSAEQGQSETADEIETSGTETIGTERIEAEKIEDVEAVDAAQDQAEEQAEEQVEEQAEQISDSSE